VFALHCEYAAKHHDSTSAQIVEAVTKLMHKAHEHCFIANSLLTNVSIEPTVEIIGNTLA
jgi:organic hydroperoxide reductase OsmC/OhrA